MWMNRQSRVEKSDIMKTSLMESDNREAAVSQPLVYVVVITYNGKRFLEKCFSTLLKTDYDNLRIVLVDNESSDGSGAFVKQHFPAVDVLRLDTNAGYAGATNAGIRYATERNAEYICVFNDDTGIIDPRWLSAAIGYCQKQPTIGVVGFEEIPDESTAVIPESIDIEDTHVVVGFGLVFRASMISQIGLLDEVYGTLAEEDDIAARAEAAGYRLCLLNIPIFHAGGGTNSYKSLRTAYFQMRNGLRFCIKNRGFLATFFRAIRTLYVACNPKPFSIDRENPGHLRVRNRGNVFVNFWLFVKAVSWNLFFLPQTLAIRHADYQKIRVARKAVGSRTNR
jgi:GT2 family glycosyltransferase